MRKQAKPAPAQLPPHSEEAEQGVLGCILLHQGCLNECEEMGDLAPMFYDLRHRTIYQVMLAIHDNHWTLDAVTLVTKLKDSRRLDEVGGHAYVLGLADKTPSATMILEYCAILREKFVLRKLLAARQRIAELVADPAMGLAEKIEQCERAVMESSSSMHFRESVTIKEAALQAMHDIETIHSRQGKIGGVSTGLVDLDRMTDGLHPGVMFTIGALTGQGKTAFAMTIAEHVAITEKLPVGILSQEMTVKQLVQRSLCSLARVNLRNVRDGFLAERDFPKLIAATGRLANSRMVIDDEPELTAAKFRAKARRMVQQHEVRMIVVDYIQLMGGAGHRDNRNQELAEISRVIKLTALNLQIPILVLCQLSRDLEKSDRRATLADIRDCGSIAHDSDVVLLLQRPVSRGEEYDHNEDAGAMKGILAKNRFGPPGDLDFFFIKCHTRFESAAKISQDDLPDAQPDLLPSRNGSLPYADT